MPSWRSASSRATARPTMPAPTTTTSHSLGGWPGPPSAIARLRIAPRWLSRSSPRSSRSSRSRASAARGRGVGVRAQVRRLPGARLRRRRRRLPAVAQRQAAVALLPRAELPGGRYVLDGELVILGEDGAEVFDALQNRLHPAESRVTCWPRRRRRASAPSTSSRWGDEAALEAVRGATRGAGGAGRGPRTTAGSVELTPLVTDPGEAEPWLSRGEGVIAKELDAPYRPGERKGMVKVKRLRTLDCVVVGWRPGKEEGTVGSLILGLYDERRAARRRPHLGLQGEGETRAGGQAGARTRPASAARRPEPLGGRPRARVGLAAAGAGGRGQLRPRERRADPPRSEAPALARRQEPARVHVRPAELTGVQRA